MIELGWLSITPPTGLSGTHSFPKCHRLEDADGPPPLPPPWSPPNHLGTLSWPAAFPPLCPSPEGEKQWPLYLGVGNPPQTPADGGVGGWGQAEG